MRTNVSDEFLIVLMEVLRPCADALEINGPAFYMLAQELANLDIDIEEITLGQLAAAYDRANKRYNTMYDRLHGLTEVANGR